MNLVKRILDFYINASIHVALAVYSLARVTMQNFHIAYDENVSYALFFGTIVGYNFLKYAGEAKKYLFVDRKHVKVVQAFSFVCFLLSVYFISKLYGETLLWVGVLVVVSFLYLVPVRSSKRNFRSLNGLKIFIVALVWALSTVILPVVNSIMYVSVDVVIETLQRFLFVVVIILPFEIRDLKTDSVALQTLPQQIGVRKTKILGVLLLILFYFLEFFKDNINSNNFLVLPIVCVLTMLLLIFSRREQSRYYSAFWVESVPILWWVLLLLF